MTDVSFNILHTNMEEYQCSWCNIFSSASHPYADHFPNTHICEECIHKHDIKPCIRCGKWACHLTKDCCWFCKCNQCDDYPTWSCERCDSYWCDICAESEPCKFCLEMTNPIHNSICPNCHDEKCLRCGGTFPSEHIIDNLCPTCNLTCSECRVILGRKQWRCYGGAGPCYKKLCQECYDVFDGKCWHCHRDSRGP